MRIAIAGGGPAGLYLALLLKKSEPTHEVKIVEQNPPDATFGFGVVFSDQALAFLQASDPSSYADVERRLKVWDDQLIVHRDQRVRIDGIAFSGISRLELLQILQRHCLEHGVQIQFGTRLTELGSLADYDLVVGADGVNSVVREAFHDRFQPSVEELTNRYVWYGTSQPFDALTLTFRENADGVFVAHHYRYAEDRSTFIVECDADTWKHAGFASMSEEASRQYCEQVFARELRGHPLLTNRSLWLTFKAITNERWSHGNVVLIGDALRTVHFSIGSGTRNALEDAIALARALTDCDSNVPAALRAFEASRRPGVEKFLDVARQSYVWYERFRQKMSLAPLPFAYDYLMRSGRITHDRLRAVSPKFVAAYEADRATDSLADNGGS